MLHFTQNQNVPPAGTAPFVNSEPKASGPSAVPHTTSVAYTKACAGSVPCSTQSFNFSAGCQAIPNNQPPQIAFHRRFPPAIGQGNPQISPSLGAASPNPPPYFAVAAGMPASHHIAPPGAPLNSCPLKVLPSVTGPPLTRQYSRAVLSQYPRPPAVNWGAQQAFGGNPLDGLQPSPVLRSSSAHVLLRGCPLPRPLPNTPGHVPCPVELPAQQMRQQTSEQSAVLYVQNHLTSTHFPQQPYQGPAERAPVERSCTQQAGRTATAYQSQLDARLPDARLSRGLLPSGFEASALRGRVPTPAAQRLGFLQPQSLLPGPMPVRAQPEAGFCSASAAQAQPVHLGNPVTLRSAVSASTVSEAAPEEPLLTVQPDMNKGKPQQAGTRLGTGPAAPSLGPGAFACSIAARDMVPAETREVLEAGSRCCNTRVNLPESTGSLCGSRQAQSCLFHRAYPVCATDGAPPLTHSAAENPQQDRGRCRLSPVRSPEGAILVPASDGLRDTADGISGCRGQVGQTSLLQTSGRQETRKGLFVLRSEAEERNSVAAAAGSEHGSSGKLEPWQNPTMPHEGFFHEPRSESSTADDALSQRVEATTGEKADLSRLVRSADFGVEQEAGCGHVTYEFCSAESDLEREGLMSVEDEDGLDEGDEDAWGSIYSGDEPVRLGDGPDEEVIGGSESEAQDEEADTYENDDLGLLRASQAAVAEADRGDDGLHTAGDLDAHQASHSDTDELRLADLDEKADARSLVTTDADIRMPWADDPCIDVQMPTPRAHAESQSVVRVSVPRPHEVSDKHDGLSAELLENSVASNPDGQTDAERTGPEEREVERTHTNRRGRSKTSRGETGKRDENAARAAAASGTIPWNEVVLNTKMCRAEKPLINTIGCRLGWARQEQVTTKGNIVWLGGSVPDHEHLQYMKPLQLINRFPGMWDMTKKRMLSRVLSLYQQLYPHLFNFSPACWSLPEDRETIEQILHSKNQEVYILKPDGGAMGNGVQLVTRYKDIDCMVLRGDGNYIMQKYISNPYLMNKRKFDFRIYCMLFSVNGTPKAYISKLGMARFCTEQYRAPTRRNIDNPFMHLTNYSINKDNTSSFIRSTDLHDDSNSKRMLKDVFCDLAKEGVNIANVWDQIKSITARTVVCLYPWLNLRYRHVYKGRESEPSRCFQLLGFDILLDADEKCWLLEVNSNPSLRIDYFDSKYEGVDVQLESAMDRHIKEPVVSEGLGLAYRLLLQDRRRCFSAGGAEKGRTSDFSASLLGPQSRLSVLAPGNAAHARSSLSKTLTPCRPPSRQSSRAGKVPLHASGRAASLERSASRPKLAVNKAASSEAEGETVPLESGKPSTGSGWGGDQRGRAKVGDEKDARVSAGRRAGSIAACSCRTAEKRKTSKVSSVASTAKAAKETKQKDLREKRAGRDAARQPATAAKKPTKRIGRRQKAEEEAADDDVSEETEFKMEHAVEKVRALLEHMEASGACQLKNSAAFNSPSTSSAPLPSAGEEGAEMSSDNELRATGERREGTELGLNVSSRMSTTTSSRVSSRNGIPFAGGLDSDEERKSHARGKKLEMLYRAAGAGVKQVDEVGDKAEPADAETPAQTQKTNPENDGEFHQEELGGQHPTEGSPLSLPRLGSADTAATSPPSSPRCAGEAASPESPRHSAEEALPSVEAKSDLRAPTSFSPQKEILSSTVLTVTGSPLPEAEELCYELNFLDAAYKEMQKCMDGFNVLGLRFANPASREESKPTEEGKKKFPPGPYKPFLRKDRVAAKKMQPQVKSSYTKLHKDILRPLSGEHAKPQHCWIDLNSSVTDLVSETTCLLRFQLLFERLIKFPKALALQRVPLLDACRVVKLPDILRKIQVPLVTPTRTNSKTGPRSFSSNASSHLYAALARGSTQDASAPLSAFGRSNSRANLAGDSAYGSCLLSSASVKSLSHSSAAACSRAGGHPGPLGLQRQRLTGGAAQAPFFSTPHLNSSAQRSMSSLSAERRRRLGLPDIEALWYYHLQSVRKQLQLPEGSYGLGLLEAWYVFEAIALICYPYLPSKAKLLEAFLHVSTGHANSHLSSAAFPSGGRRLDKTEPPALERGLERSRSQTVFVRELEEALRKVEEEERQALQLSKRRGKLSTKAKGGKCISAQTSDQERSDDGSENAACRSDTDSSSLQTLEGQEYSEAERFFDQTAPQRDLSSRSTTGTAGDAGVSKEKCAASVATLQTARAGSGFAANARGRQLGTESRNRSRLPSASKPRNSGSAPAAAEEPKSRMIGCGRRLSSLPSRLQRQLLSDDKELEMDEKLRGKSGGESLLSVDKNRNAGCGDASQTDAPVWHEGLCSSWPDIGEFVCHHVPAEDRKAAMERLIDYFQLRWDLHNYCVLLQGKTV
ncbi:Tubulin-tyrosine ligase family protein [Besnoitia besnoiti]|uniref:Tubulin-tyrosine ligase family protein n=1 Tax=Besnoitia besnoiti TaxID=94643 RepID=A0A2A9MB99_BESBE|nr:Tubulin-tyrosine ligase family protein [Besnoitia besnoiti]PFH32897.1 Tubulin-tyrosine ligase family protein [Besnoitia besnoiti]